MQRRDFLAAAALVTSTQLVPARSATAQDRTDDGSAPAKFRAPGPARKSPRSASDEDDPTAESDPKGKSRAAEARGGNRVRVSPGRGGLPNDAGQVWKEYDITPYTDRLRDVERPEQAIVDWILRETGYEAWHSEPMGLLSANQRALVVYHTPQMQRLVESVVERFIREDSEEEHVGLRVISIGRPDWRAKHHRLLRPVPTQTQGIDAWLLHREEATLLLADLSRRFDFREYGAPRMTVAHGRTDAISGSRERGFVRDIAARADAFPAFDPLAGKFEEGFAVELSPLLSEDGTMVDAVIQCHIDQLERLVAVSIDVPSQAATRQRGKLEVPQVSQFRLHERFRWPSDQVLVVGMGVVPTPAPRDPNPILSALPIGNSPPRADLLVFVEAGARAGMTAGAGSNRNPDDNRSRNRNGVDNRGRY